MKLLLPIVLILASCGAETNLYDNFSDLESNIHETGKDLDKNTRRNAGDVVRNTRSNLQDLNKNVLENGKDLNGNVVEFGHETVENFNDEKSRVKEAALGSDSDRVTDVEQHNIEQDERLDTIEGAIEDIETLLDLIQSDLSGLGDELDLEVAAINSELDNVADTLVELDEVDSKLKRKIRRLKRRITRVARNDDYCTIEEDFAVFLTISCPNGDYTIFGWED